MPSSKTDLRTGRGNAATAKTVSGVTATPMIASSPTDSVGDVTPDGTRHFHSAQDVLTKDPLYPNAEVAIHAATSALAPRPPQLGEYAAWTAFTGIPDWGSLKTNDSSLVARNLVVSTNDSGDIYPYYWQSPTVCLDAPSTPQGADPASDAVFNSGLTVLDIPGAGPGLAYTGAFTRPGSAGGPAQPVVRTARILPRSGTTRLEVTLSGQIYPADRGVLALIHWPADGDTTAFLAQDLHDRCIAATLLGQGLLEQSNCFQGYCGTMPSGDGMPGGIFEVGISDNRYDPFVFPGRATGQYDLNELHTGVSSLDGVTPLPAPYSAAVRLQDSEVPAAGQVRLGTHPSAGVATTSWGIPVLGATAAAYSPGPGTTINGYASLHNTLTLSSNFFRYRLPVLEDYSLATGLKYTPSGVSRENTRETFRYFRVPSPATVTDFTQAGNYPDFNQDCFEFQLARYRHTFALPSTAILGDRQEVGSYWLIHFKTEANFEAFVRDGVMPWDGTNPYSVYGASLVDTTSLEDYANVVNEETSSTVAAPRGPAPAYGYGSESRHVLKSSVFQDPNGVSVDPLDWVGLGYTFTVTSTPGVENNIMWISGVAYFTPRRWDTGAAGFSITGISGVGSDFWNGSYCTDDTRLTSGVAPAQLSSLNPAFLGIAAFAFSDTPSVSLTTGVAGAALTTSSHVRRHRLEIPFTHLGTEGGSPFSDSNGPRINSTATFNLVGNITFTGDDVSPAFTTDAKFRLFLRRPLGHDAANTIPGPFSATDGHGMLLPPTPSYQILYHSSQFSSVVTGATFGNYITGAAPSPAYAELGNTADSFFKKYRETFLDEVFRWDHTFPSLPSSTHRALQAPGMGVWGGGPADVPVAVGHEVAWAAGSWVQNEYHLDSLVGVSAPADTGLQVSGFPDRNPPVTDGAKVPFPSRGILQYPQVDYSTGFAPETLTHITAAQPDYSTAPGAGGTREFVRLLDANRAGTQALQGSQTFKIRVDGLNLEDFQYTPPGPGTLGVANRGIAIQVKVPGLTTWMDLGRVDGDGPSKQDPLVDGAGCQVVGPDTFDGVDSETKLVYCQVQVNVGPVATLFLSSFNEVPIAVRVLMDENATNYDFRREYLGGGLWGASAVGHSSTVVRGICGLEIVSET